jgi:hypothetical protein
MLHEQLFGGDGAKIVSGKNSTCSLVTPLIGEDGKRN